MPIVINEIVIKTNVETSSANPPSTDTSVGHQASAEEIVKQTVAKVLEILEEKKQR